MPTRIRKDDGSYVDADDVAVQGAAVANAAALTATAPASATATNPTAPAAYSAHAAGSVPVTSNAATDLDTTAAALAALRAEVATYETAISALVVDSADLRTKLAAVVVDLAAIRTAHQNLLGELELSGALTAN